MGAIVQEQLFGRGDHQLVPTVRSHRGPRGADPPGPPVLPYH
jgi:hypothetical protein